MKNKSKEYKISQELRKIAYMLCMVAVIFLADIAVVNATSEDDGAAAERILDNQIEENENRTNINDPGTAETGEDLKELNIANNLKITYDSGNGELNGTLRILLILTAIAVLPILLVTLTSFTRILIVLHFTRQALNTQSAPPNQVLIAISLFLTFYIMQPVFAKVYTEAIVPYDAGEIGFEEAIDIASAPMRDFMFEQTQRDDINVFMQISNVAWDGETFAQPRARDRVPGFGNRRHNVRIVLQSIARSAGRQRGALPHPTAERVQN